MNGIADERAVLIETKRRLKHKIKVGFVPAVVAFMPLLAVFYYLPKHPPVVVSVLLVALSIATGGIWSRWGMSILYYIDAVEGLRQLNSKS